ncbi:hypothetical protein [Senegalia massiliensis]|uniref:Uncharacterized protein n=1 Tax=Senegalia massiliensis TaxID=1720316 RepID=A0A845QVK8_9CLOT|nr:hypothetical protein [Senegalia massiliensis]NBI06271.1 hypothetical protein [Senegalia massiliensis]
MKKKILIVLLTFMLALNVIACDTSSDPEEPDLDEEPAEDPNDEMGDDEYEPDIDEEPSEEQNEEDGLDMDQEDDNMNEEDKKTEEEQ